MTATTQGAEIRRATSEMYEEMRSLPPSSKDWIRIRDKIVESNWGIVIHIANKHSRRFGLSPDEAIQEVALLLIEILPIWDPSMATLDRFLWFKASERLRQVAESTSYSGLSGTTAAKRRLVRAEKVALDLEMSMGRKPTDTEIVSEVNRRAVRRHNDPVRSGSLLTVEELQKARGAFRSKNYIDDSFTEISWVIHPEESSTFVNMAVDHTARNLSTLHAEVISSRLSLGEPDSVGQIRPWKEVSRHCKVSTANAKRIFAEAVEFIAEHLTEITSSDRQIFFT